MKLYVSEKLISLHNKFFITDENGNDVYEITSKFISIGDKTTINDMQGNKVVYIEQEILHLMPTYRIFIDDVFILKIYKKFQFLRNDYVLSNRYRVDGNILMFDFVIYDENNNRIGSIKRQFISIGDKYEITIDDMSKGKIILAIIVAITNDVNRRQRRK